VVGDWTSVGVISVKINVGALGTERSDKSILSWAYTLISVAMNMMLVVIYCFMAN
jgi:hypothetical protein